MAKRKPAPQAKPLEPPKPFEPPKKDPAQERADEIAAMVNDPDKTRNDLIHDLQIMVDNWIEEASKAGHEEGEKEGFEMGVESVVDETLEALAVIGRDWETGRALLERALGGKIFGLGTNRVELFY